MGKYIDGSGLAHFMGILKGYFTPKTSNVASVTRSGTTFTAKNSDGTQLFTFTQQDNTVSKTATTPKMDGTAAIGSETAYAAGDHVHPTDTSRAPVSHASTATTYGIGTASNYGHVKLSDSTTSTSAASSGVAASPKAVNAAVAEANGYSDGILASAKAYADTVVGTVATTPFTGATETTAGAMGCVPAPATGQNLAVLRGDGGWEEIGDTLAAAAGISDPSGELGFLELSTDQDDSVVLSVRELGAADIPNLPASKITSGTLGVARGGTGVSTLGAGVVYHSASGTGALSIATAANIVSAIGTNAVARATGDADGSAIKTTYAKLASPALTGTPTAPTAAAGTNTTQIATTAFVTNAVGTATAGALQYKGTATEESDISGQAYKKGWYYVVSTAGTYFGKACEVGDMLIAKQDKTSTTSNDWDAIQSNIEVLSNSEIDTLWAAA